jgi:hypothetical protein
MDSDVRSTLIEMYAAGHDEVVRALEGFPAGQLTARPIPGKWSAAEIVHHLADSEMQSAVRLRKLLAEPAPVIQGYDQEEWAVKLHYNERPIGPSLAALKAARETTLQLFAHTDSGSYHCERWLEIYAEHAHGHARQIAALKAALTQ